MIIWPSGLRRQFKALFRKGEGSNPSVIISFFFNEKDKSKTIRKINGKIAGKKDEYIISISFQNHLEFGISNKDEITTHNAYLTLFY